MKFTRLLGGVAAGAGAVLVGNRALRRRDLEPPLGRPQSTYRWRGLDVAYTEAGDPDDPDLVLLHGINAAGSSHEFRYVVDALAEEYHVIAPDLPGFGGSDRPPIDYSASLYATFVEEFLADLADEPFVVAVSLSAAYVADAEPEELRGLLLVCPTATTIPGRRAWLRSLLRSRVVGEALFNLLVSRPAIRYFLVDHGFAQEANVTDEWVEYDWASAHQPGARFAPASFVGGFLDSDVDLGTSLAAFDVPITIVWGRDAEIAPLSKGEALATAANATLVSFSNAGLLPHAEHPEAFVEQLRTALPA